MSSLLDSHDALGLAALVKAREISASELLEAAIARAEAADARFSFMAQRHYDRARAKVAAGLPDGPFTGVPWLLKDLNTYLEGTVTANGSRLYRDAVAPVSSELVRRIEAAGFVVFGKTASPEFGQTATTENKLSGQTRNPWDPSRIAGGSSGGASAAVAAGVIPAAHATDGGGSIRIPASCCGLFGLKPSRGRVPMGPLRTEGWGGLSVHHAVSWTVRDSAAILDCTHGQEPGARYVAPNPAGPFLSVIDRDPRSLRIALMTRPLSGAPVDPQCVAAAQAAAKLCEGLGHHIEEAAPVIDAAAVGNAAFQVMSSSIAADIEDRAAATGQAIGPATLEPITLAAVAFGRSVGGMDVARANATFQTAALAMSRFLDQFDVILSPTLTAPPLALGTINLDPGVDFREWGARVGPYAAFTQLANVTGQPSMSVPLAMSDDGLPIGVMFSGRYGEEALLYALAGQLERAAPWIGRKPRI